MSGDISMHKEVSKREIIKDIIIERLRQMSPNFKVTLGSTGEFLSRDEMIDEVEKGSNIGEKILKIQVSYLKSLKERAYK